MLDSVKSQYTNGNRHGGTQHRTDLKVDRPSNVTPRTMAAILRAADKAADLAFSGGYNITRGNICGMCHEAKSVNGSCGC